MVYTSPAFGPQMIEIDTEYEGDSTLPSPTWTSASALEGIARSRGRFPARFRPAAAASSAGSTSEIKCKEKGNGTQCAQNCPCGIDAKEFIEAEIDLTDGNESNPLHAALMKIKDRRHQGVRVERKIEKRIGKAIRLRRRKPDYSAQDERAKGKERLRQPRPHVPPPSPPGTSTSDLMGKLGEINFDTSSTLDGGSYSTYYEGLDFELEEHNDVYMQSPKESPRQTCGQPSRVPTGVAPWIPDDLDTCTTTPNPPPPIPPPASSVDEQEFSNQSTPISPAGLGKSPMSYDPLITR